MLRRVLAVDDMQINLEILEAILSDEYIYSSAESGAEALELMHGENQPDLVLLDLSMPGMDGFELLGRMRKDEILASIPVIFVTGETDQYSEEKGLKLGAVDYIKKPYNPDIIKVKIRNHIELKTYRDDLEIAVRQRTKELHERTDELSAAHAAVIMGMSLLSESRDKVTGAHLARIKSLTRIIVDDINITYPEIISKNLADTIVQYSPLHDVGKVAVPDAVLNKKGALTREEFEVMKTHTSGGGDVLRQTAGFMSGGAGSGLQVAIDIAEGHHEKYDGSGYPSSKKGDEIPISARIVSIADIYDALRSSRPYKRGFTHEEACDIILVGDGRTSPDHFDPIVLDAFKKCHLEMKKAFDDNPDPSLAEHEHG